MKNNLSIFNNLRPITVGFDNMFDHFEHMMDDSFFGRSIANFPPYNIVKTGENTYDVELALAGFNKKDIEVEYKESQLTVKSCLLYTSPSPRDATLSRMPSSA